MVPTTIVVWTGVMVDTTKRSVANTAQSCGAGIRMSIDVEAMRQKWSKPFPNQHAYCQTDILLLCAEVERLQGELEAIRERQPCECFDTVLDPNCPQHGHLVVPLPETRTDISHIPRGNLGGGRDTP
jgi:hypothetical protein